MENLERRGGKCSSMKIPAFGLTPLSRLKCKDVSPFITQRSRSAQEREVRVWAPGGTTVYGAEHQRTGNCAGKTIPESSQDVSLNVQPNTKIHMLTAELHEDVQETSTRKSNKRN